MAIWDDISQDPLKMMILMQGMQELPRSLSRQNLPPSNMPGYAQGGGGYGGGGSGGGLDMGSILRMQQIQAAQANQQADNELQRQQFEMNRQKAVAEQQQAQERAAMVERAIPGLVESTGQSADVVRAVLLGGIEPSNPLLKAVGALAEPYTMSGGQVRFGPGNTPVAQVADKTEIGSFLPASGEHTIDQSVLAANRMLRRDGATRVSVDASQIDKGFGAMQEIAQKEREKMIGDVAAIGDQAMAARELTEMAVNKPEWVGPAADARAAAIRAWGGVKNLAGVPMTPEETEFLSFYDRAKEINLDSAIAKAQKLTPVTTVELQKAEDSVLGPGSMVPDIVRRSARLNALYDYAKRKADYSDQVQSQMLLDAKRGGEPYNAARHRLAIQEWEKSNPVYTPQHVAELKAMSERFPGGGPAKKIPAPQAPPKAGTVPDDDPLGLLGP